VQAVLDHREVLSRLLHKFTSITTTTTTTTAATRKDTGGTPVSKPIIFGVITTVIVIATVIVAAVSVVVMVKGTESEIGNQLRFPGGHHVHDALYPAQERCQGLNINETVQ
jgi:hypothetical protein